MIVIVLVIAASILALIYFNGKYNEHYWKKRGVAFYEKSKVTGPFWDFVVRDRALFELFNDMYKEYPNEPAVGFGAFFTPALYVKDPVNIQHIAQTDFHSFNHRGLAYREEDTLANNILMLHGTKWKVVRQSMTPLFTSNKLKNMYYIIDKSAQDFVEYLKTNPDKHKGNAFETLYTFCAAAFGAAVFGMETKSNFESPFIEVVKDALSSNLWNNIKYSLSSFSPTLFNLLRLSLFSRQEEWFLRTIKKVIRQREIDNVKKHDFADLCVTLQKNGTLRDHDTGFQVEPTDELMAAQAFFFFMAGLDPTTSILFAAMVELGRNPEILKKVHNEIDEVFERHNGQISYDVLSKMKYAAMVINEAMRMYPVVGYLTRECVKDTVLPVGNIPVEKGTKIFCPTFELHHDEKYFPDPEVFNPERFSSEKKVNESAYLPYGRGKRSCIGAKLGKLQVMAGLVYVLRHFSVNTFTAKTGMKYKKHQAQVRLDADFEFIPRSV